MQRCDALQMANIPATLSRLSSTKLVSFAAIGAVGFVIDASILMILFHKFGFGHYSGRLVSFSLAVFVTWYLNRKFTFRQHSSPDWKSEVRRYIYIQVIGSAINLAVYAALISSSATLAEYPVLPLVVGASVALVFNFLGSRWFVFTNSAEQAKAANNEI